VLPLTASKKKVKKSEWSPVAELVYRGCEPGNFSVQFRPLKAAHPLKFRDAKRVDAADHVEI
jgi:hypothetical protein